MNQSEKIDLLAKALSIVQSQIEGAKLDSKNPFFKSSYADLTSVWEACRGPLTENGLSVAQTVETLADRICVVTTLMHSSGQWIKGSLPLLLMKTDMQSLGSAITYARRYSLAAMVGVCPEDDDGEASVGRENKSAPQIKSMTKVGIGNEGF